MIDRTQFWIVVVVLGVATYLIRFSFLGLLGNRALPGWLLRCLRYTAVAVLPALVAPAVMWPTATNGQPDAARLLAAAVTVVVGLVTRQMMFAAVAGIGTLLGMQFLL
ncbi:AzlD domain-containing protein [Cypionkella sp.]|uniref:AzlD domain-containing protein n=1 Tax=Cypionkella sp. TaxID=2811411 RepID=UPI00262CA501|nr:AzlD domain-containing protein [Cypionkella sp.]MDB5665340.1 AzlD protein [Cypionkella sp.]